MEWVRVTVSKLLKLTILFVLLFKWRDSTNIQNGKSTAKLNVSYKTFYSKKNPNSHPTPPQRLCFHHVFMLRRNITFTFQTENHHFQKHKTPQNFTNFSTNFPSIPSFIFFFSIQNIYFSSIYFCLFLFSIQPFYYSSLNFVLKMCILFFSDWRSQSESVPFGGRHPDSKNFEHRTAGTQLQTVAKRSKRSDKNIEQRSVRVYRNGRWRTTVGDSVALTSPLRRQERTLRFRAK